MALADTDFRYRRRKLVSSIMLGAAAVSAIGMMLVLFLILGQVVLEGGRWINLDFFTELPRPLGQEGGGMAHAIVGSLIVLGIACVLSLPVGFFTGIYLSEYANDRLAGFVRFVVETMAGVPSIVVGIFVYVLLVRPMGTYSAIAGGFALAVIMVPIFARAAEEALRTVPFSLKEGAMALGIPSWRIVLRIVVPTAGPGIITAAMLAIARAGGETAPLLFTALGNRFWHEGLTSPIATLPVQIYTYAIGPYTEWHQQAWAAALVLVGVTVGIIGIVRLLYRGTQFKQL
jgi:phosphate transport system permease protein